MPPKAKFTKEEIIEAAVNLVRAKGFHALTARALGTKLGSSSRPIFTVFQSMEELQNEVIKAARQMYNLCIQEGLSNPAFQGKQFKSVGANYILFSMKEPKLFQLLFMREQHTPLDFSGILPLIDENYDSIIASIQGDYGLDLPSAKTLYQHMWVYTHGIASLCATGMCRFSADEIGQMEDEVCLCLLNKLKK